jgi:hypothetical protein
MSDNLRTRRPVTKSPFAAAALLSMVPTVKPHRPAGRRPDVAPSAHLRPRPPHPAARARLHRRRRRARWRRRRGWRGQDDDERPRRRLGLGLGGERGRWQRRRWQLRRLYGRRWRHERRGHRRHRRAVPTRPAHVLLRRRRELERLGGRALNRGRRLGPRPAWSRPTASGRLVVPELAD